MPVTSEPGIWLQVSFFISHTSELFYIKASPMWAPAGVEPQAQKGDEPPGLCTGAAQHPSAGTLLTDIQHWCCLFFLLLLSTAASDLCTWDKWDIFETIRNSSCFVSCFLCRFGDRAATRTLRSSLGIHHCFIPVRLW